MKKIKNMSQLREQKAILTARQLQAEKNVRLHWNNIKEEFKLVNLAAEAIDKITPQPATEKTGQKNILKNTLTYGLTLLAQKLADKADEKIKKAFKK
jgi:hypothetical protein